MLHSGGDDQGYTGLPTFVANERRLCKTRCSPGENASYEKLSPHKRDGREVSRRRNQDSNDVLCRTETGATGEGEHTSAAKVSTAIQTESCDTLNVSRETLAAYTIAVVQNTQSAAFEYMQVPMQECHNQLTLQTPLKAEQYMCAHYNLVILVDNTTNTYAAPEQNIIGDNKPPHPLTRTRRPSPRPSLQITVG